MRGRRICAARASGGSAIQDAITHFYNTVEWLVGPTDRLITDAVHLHLGGVEVEDTINTIARHGGVMVSYAINMYEPSNEMTITATCTQGAVQCDWRRVRWPWATGPGVPWQHHPADVFLDAVEGRGQPLCTLDDAITTLRTSLTLLRSAEQNNWKNVQ